MVFICVSGGSASFFVFASNLQSTFKLLPTLTTVRISQPYGLSVFHPCVVLHSRFGKLRPECGFLHHLPTFASFNGTSWWSLQCKCALQLTASAIHFVPLTSQGLLWISPRPSAFHVTIRTVVAISRNQHSSRRQQQNTSSACC